LSDYNPYTPPVHDDDASRPPFPGGASWDGQSLTVPKQLSFPRVCLKCASGEVHSRRTQKFAFTPVWARLLVLVCWPGALVAMLLTTQRATLELPLCDACHDRWRKARNRSIGLGLGMFASIMLASFATASSRSPGGGLILLVGILIGAVGLLVGMNKLVRPHLILAKKIDEDFVTLTGVAPPAGERVALSGR
jgi:hypothetical protein